MEIMSDFQIHFKLSILGKQKITARRGPGRKKGEGVKNPM